MTISELQQQIGAWHVEQFGETNPDLLLAMDAKLEEELGEMADATNVDEWGNEIADVIICLIGMAHRCGIDIESRLMDKFDVVRDRDQRAMPQEVE